MSKSGNDLVGQNAQVLHEGQPKTVLINEYIEDEDVYLLVGDDELPTINYVKWAKREEFDLTTKDGIFVKDVNFITIYTDGSCNNVSKAPRKGGWAAKIEYHAEEARFIYGQIIGASSNMMEIKAIYEALKSIPAGLEHAEVTIYSDSEWAVRSLNNEYRRNMYHERGGVVSWSEIEDEAARFKSVTYKHTRGHVGTQGNEECDKIAGIVREFGTITEDSLKRITG